MLCATQYRKTPSLACVGSLVVAFTATAAGAAECNQAEPERFAQSVQAESQDAAE